MGSLLRNVVPHFVRRAIRKWTQRSHEPLLSLARGVIHVGAHLGQERHEYARHNLPTVWIEPNPAIFPKLVANLAEFPSQRAVQYLITDRDDAEYAFHVANNEGQSSSVLELNRHREMWPDVEFERDIVLKSYTLDTVVAREHIDPRRFDTLVMDTQGTEMLVLRGGMRLLESVRFIRTEVADFDAYVGGTTLWEMQQVLTALGFRETARHSFAGRDGVGQYYNIEFRRAM